MTEENKDLTPEEKALERNRRRFAGFRYSFRGPSGFLGDSMVLEFPGLYAYPRRGIQSDGPTEIT